MTFVTGSITNANPGPALYAALEPTLLAAGFTLDDTVVIGARTHKIMKSAAAGNRIGKDFFLDISYPTTGAATRLLITPFEGYTAGTDVGIRGPYATNDATAPEQVNFSRYGDAASALETNWANAAATYTVLGLALSTAVFNYWVSITQNRIIIFVSSDTTMLYSGLFLPTQAHADFAGSALFPLITANLVPGATASVIANNSNTAASVRCVVTRIPRFPGVSASHVENYGWMAAASIHHSLNLTSGSAGRAAGYATGEIALGDLLVLFGTLSGPNLYSGFVGTLDGVGIGYVATAAVRGDTVDIGPDTWYMAQPASNVGLFMQGV